MHVFNLFMWGGGRSVFTRNIHCHTFQALTWRTFSDLITCTFNFDITGKKIVRLLYPFKNLHYATFFSCFAVALFCC